MLEDPFKSKLWLVMAKYKIYDNVYAMDWLKGYQRSVEMKTAMKTQQ